MKLSISNIAWEVKDDSLMYEYISEQGFEGIEIAPTRIIKTMPYENIEAAKNYCSELKSRYSLSISSMQSIWYGINQNFFNSIEDRDFLIGYTKKAIDFAKSIQCNNLVFGCPKNRVIRDLSQYELAVSFFEMLGKYAVENDTVISIEANPTIYNTNFINTTAEAFVLCEDVDCEGFKVNLDLGTMIFNNETLEDIYNSCKHINHIHISEPYLEVIQERKLHKEIKLLEYNKYFSIEMKNPGNIEIVKNTIEYIKRVFDNE